MWKGSAFTIFTPYSLKTLLRTAAGGEAIFCLILLRGPGSAGSFVILEAQPATWSAVGRLRSIL
jgi:hypothetical protein